ncbi:alanine racemase [Phaeovibrio sulfidiphilus]|uniref:Alanine racemase n=1 Tax=Phaeovibrio sulfidiphilus TaxID=1220600 RepID=A0A8J6YKM6_9PROT|nr:alanine racemase [Phaeovibrio sulfidiphilus]MBE1236340.1 alanine racemase [Phaeovibrio sulfidiphilus]
METSGAQTVGATTALTIDLDALVGNWCRIRDALGAAPGCSGAPGGAAGTEAAAVVKADAYGCGARTVAPALYRAGCRTFFVANLSEALDLRPVLPRDAALAVLCGPHPGEEGFYRDAGLTPVLNSATQMAFWHAVPFAATWPCFWHIDTGMTRLGLDPDDLPPALPYPDNPPVLMTHLACADEPEHPVNPDQVARFRAALDRIPGGHALRTSVGASGGIVLGGPYHGNLVRPGIVLYGGNPAPGHAAPLSPVVRLQAKILQIRHIDTPKTVGYGATARVEKGARLATVGIGYADGYPRSASNRAVACLGDYRLPVTGRVSMDLVTLDVSHVPEHLTPPGTMVDMIGPDYGIEDLAQAAGLISYEILTGLKPRCPRVYGPIGPGREETA